MHTCIEQHKICMCVPQLTDSSLELLTARCSHLETLDISQCPKLTGVTLRSITQVRRWIAMRQQDSGETSGWVGSFPVLCIDVCRLRLSMLAIAVKRF